MSSLCNFGSDATCSLKNWQNKVEWKFKGTSTLLKYWSWVNVLSYIPSLVTGVCGRRRKITGVGSLVRWTDSVSSWLPRWWPSAPSSSSWWESVTTLLTCPSKETRMTTERRTPACCDHTAVTSLRSVQIQTFGVASFGLCCGSWLGTLWKRKRLRKRKMFSVFFLFCFVFEENETRILVLKSEFRREKVIVFFYSGCVCLPYFSLWVFS